MKTFYSTLDHHYGSLSKAAALDQVRSYIEQAIAPVLTAVDDPATADLIVAGGGDGHMLKTMRKHIDQHDAVFLGLNAGTVGFMMNHVDADPITPLCPGELELVSSPVIPVALTMADQTRQTGFYLNDALLGGHVSDYFSFEVEGEQMTFQVNGSGLIVNTPQGSTGYAANLGQPIINLESSLQGLAGIGTQGLDYRYISPQTLTITETRGRDILDVVLDGKGGQVFQGVTSIEIVPATQSRTIAFLPGQDYQDRRIRLAEKSHGNVII